MRFPTGTLSAAIACVLGIIQCYVILFGWPYIGAYSPIPGWLISLGLRAGELQVASGAFDFLLNALLAFPAALVLCNLRPARLKLYLLLACTFALLWLKAGFVGGYSNAWLLPLLALPVATVVISFWFHRQTPNNSFKPKPLRGSA